LYNELDQELGIPKQCHSGKATAVIQQGPNVAKRNSR
jgi:hypothetical protein